MARKLLPKEALFLNLFDSWYGPQIKLSLVYRWGDYTDKNPKLRKQTVLQHEHSVTRLVQKILVLLLMKLPQLNVFLLLYAFSNHDEPEGYLKRKRDKSVRKKKEEDELKEYFLFKKINKNLPKEIYVFEEYAYLLQYATKDFSFFPSEAKTILRKLRKSNLLEAKIFRFLEYWEYIFYAYESYKMHGDKLILTQVLRREIPKLQSFVFKIPELREVFPKIDEEWFLSFINENIDIPFE